MTVFPARWARSRASVDSMSRAGGLRSTSETIEDTSAMLTTANSAMAAPAAPHASGSRAPAGPKAWYMISAPVIPIR